MSTTYIAYTRVSTTKQSSYGTSLGEQRRAIQDYAKKNNFEIIQWIEEVESASKGRRYKFKKIIDELKHKQSLGLIIHKIDRGARSLRDWADIGELIDAGVDIRFAHDDLDLSTRGGRLTADIQAVIATDYIRNLSEEVKKGIEGRLRQGIYPFNTPLGYRGQGRGKVKVPDPILAPIIVEAFRQYSTGNYSLNELALRMSILGLSKRNGKPITPGTLSKILKRPFYVGDFSVKGVVYHGQHQPLVTRELFNRVQKQLERRGSRKRLRHCFLYSRRLRCKKHGYLFVGEQHLKRDKKYIYYRCPRCRGLSLTEKMIQELEHSPMRPFDVITPTRAVLEPFEKFDSPWLSTPKGVELRKTL